MKVYDTVEDVVYENNEGIGWHFGHYADENIISCYDDYEDREVERLMEGF